MDQQQRSTRLCRVCSSDCADLHLEGLVDPLNVAGTGPVASELSEEVGPLVGTGLDAVVLDD